VALTFHGNGDLALSRQLLEVATQAGAHITIFVVGSWLANNPAFVPLVSDHGHEWANHTYTHPDLGSLDASAVYSEIVRCRDVLSRLTGTPAKWFRPSAMNHATPLVLEQAGKAGYSTAISYDVDPSDYKNPGSQTVTRRTLAMVKPGSIVSLHLGHEGTLKALPDILTGLRSANLKAVTVGELLAT
jgi:peptidoglycan/xylan/chitin deacetylase (PgdA/CDA1 family)